MRTTPTIALIGALALTGGGWAAPADPASGARPARVQTRNAVDRSYADPGAATFASFDVNRDGYISREEAAESSELARVFDARDKDRDGRLSLHELTGWINRAYTTPASAKARHHP